MFICKTNHVSPRIDRQEAQHSTRAPALSGRDSTYAVLADQTGAVRADTAVVANNELALHLPRFLISISDPESPPTLGSNIAADIEGIADFKRGQHTIRGSPCRTCGKKKLVSRHFTKISAAIRLKS